MTRSSNSLSLPRLVNGVLKQDGSTADFMADVPTVIAKASRLWILEPGDVIATGTPAGVGHARGEYLADGDDLRVEITGPAPLVNSIRTRTPARHRLLAVG